MSVSCVLLFSAERSAAAIAATSLPASSWAARAAPASAPSLPEISAAAASTSCIAASLWASPCAPILFLRRVGQPALGALGGGSGLGELVGRLRGRGPEPEQALPAGRAAPGPVRAQQITVGGDDRHRRVGPHQLQPSRQVGHDENSCEQPPDRGGQAPGRLH
jgi:hypothetical protein